MAKLVPLRAMRVLFPVLPFIAALPPDSPAVVEPTVPVGELLSPELVRELPSPELGSYQTTPVEADGTIGGVPQPTAQGRPVVQKWRGCRTFPSYPRLCRLS